MNYELLQPWSTFVMKTQLPPPILEKIIRITDEIVENRAGSDDIGAGQMYSQFWMDLETLKQEGVVDFFLDVCRNYIVQAFCQSAPLNKENTLKEEWTIWLTSMWINSQRDNEYFPTHIHTQCAISSVMYLKIPEYLPGRRVYNDKENNVEEDGSIEFSNNCSYDQIWGRTTLRIQPLVGDFFIFPSAQLHQVYPFRTPDGKGERRSVSFNVDFMKKYAKALTVEAI